MNEISTLITPHKSQCKVMVTWLMYNARPQATAPITMQHNSHVADVLYIVTCQTCCLKERCAVRPPATMHAGDVAKAVPVRRMDLSPAISVYEMSTRAGGDYRRPAAQPETPWRNLFHSIFPTMFLWVLNHNITL